MVTRTVEQADVTVLCVNPATREVTDKHFAISATITPDKVCKYLTKVYPDENTIYTAVTDYKITEILYGMTEEKFIQLSEILPPRTTAEPEND